MKEATSQARWETVCAHCEAIVKSHNTVNRASMHVDESVKCYLARMRESTNVFSLLLVAAVLS